MFGFVFSCLLFTSRSVTVAPYSIFALVFLFFCITPFLIIVNPGTRVVFYSFVCKRKHTKPISDSFANFFPRVITFRSFVTCAPREFSVRVKWASSTPQLIMFKKGALVKSVSFVGKREFARISSFYCGTFSSSILTVTIFAVDNDVVSLFFNRLNNGYLRLC